MGVMTLETRTPRLAVLIDGESVTAPVADALFQRIAELGLATIRRIYGDFTNPAHAPWIDCLQRHAIVACQQFKPTPRKNAADIALVVDAMDLMHGGLVDVFCIVASDRDFTRLALRIREQGLSIYGFGNAKTPEAFQNACTFQTLESLSSKAIIAAVPDVTSAAVAMLREAYRRLSSNRGSVHPGRFGQMLRQLDPAFNFPKYNVSNFSQLIALDVGFAVDPQTRCIKLNAV